MTVEQKITAVAAFCTLVVACITFAILGLGMAPVIIVGGPGLLAFLFWGRTYLRRPAEPTVILPLFLITVAGFEAHLVEEYFGHYGPAISRLFDIGWTDQSFVVICFLLSAALSLVSIGLYQRKPIAGFVVSLFLFTRLAEVALFVFPLIRPSVLPDIAHTVSQAVASGAYVAEMPNYYWRVVGNYYFPGMYTVVLPILPALYSIYRLWQGRPPMIVNRKHPSS